ncbi:unnamed protein product [Taenia asiatica]|uniref:Uncharacterized protein n=1 Tax=Taenia asiatica TaxID=60517 RepID=A0A3P6PK15_TAEAS|nr:unnamed protein product [Taenia asiatica]
MRCTFVSHITILRLLGLTTPQGKVDSPRSTPLVTSISVEVVSSSAKKKNTTKCIQIKATCNDKRGYEPTSQVDPSCVNINECQDEDANPCLNGGVVESGVTGVPARSPAASALKLVSAHVHNLECLDKPEQAGNCNRRVLSCENVKNTTTKDGTSDIAYTSEERKLSKRVVLITDSLAFAPMGVFGILVVTVILCQPSDFALRHREPAN